jgi:hypothetical protein
MKRNLTLAALFFALAAAMPGSILYLGLPEKIGLCIMFAFLIAGAGFLAHEVHEQRKVIRYLRRVMPADPQESQPERQPIAVINEWTGSDL